MKKTMLTSLLLIATMTFPALAGAGDIQEECLNGYIYIISTGGDGYATSVIQKYERVGNRALPATCNSDNKDKKKK